MIDSSASYNIIQYYCVIGLLDPPKNISIVSKSYSSIQLQWTPPFSLLITGDFNDTMHFLVSITNKLTGNMLYENLMTAQLGYVFHRRDYVHCSRIIFKIAAVNKVGRGAFSEGIEAGFAGRMLTVNFTAKKKKKKCSLLSQI